MMAEVQREGSSKRACMKKIGNAIKWMAGILLVILLCAVGCVWYAVKIEPYMVRTKELALDTSLSEPLTIVQVSDIQISENYTIHHFQKVVDRIISLEPDILLFTGDLYENYAAYHDNENLVSQLSQIQPRYGKFAIWGNRDYGGGAVRQYQQLMEASGFYLLQNEGVTVTTDSGEQLLLAGLDDALLGEPDLQPVIAQYSPDNYPCSILMIHEPDLADQYAQDGFDLMLAGHSHGGQVDVPFLPPLTTSLAEKYQKGLYQLNDDTALYVNCGIGTSHYPVRFGVPPELTVFCLNPRSINN